jgi:hypothetical protein
MVIFVSPWWNDGGSEHYFGAYQMGEAAVARGRHPELGGAGPDPGAGQGRGRHEMGVEEQLEE